MTRIKKYSQNLICLLLYISPCYASYNVEENPDIDLRTVKSFASSVKITEEHQNVPKPKNVWTRIEEKKPLKPDFLGIIYENDLKASQAFSQQHIQPLIAAELLRDKPNRPFAEAQQARVMVKTAIAQMKKDASSYYNKNKHEEACYIWRAILKSRYYDNTLEDRLDTLYIFYEAKKYLSSIDLAEKLIDQKEADLSELKIILLAFNNLSKFIKVPLEDKTLDTILYACKEIYDHKYETLHSEKIVSQSLTHLRNIYSQYWVDKVITNTYWSNILNTEDRSKIRKISYEINKD